MEKLLKIKLLLFCLLQLTLSYGQNKPNPIRLDSALTALHQLQLFNGVVLVAQDGQVLYKKAFGQNDAGGKPS